MTHEERDSVRHALERAAVSAWREGLRNDSDAERTVDRVRCQEEALRDWLCWIFESGPHPHHVMRRLVAATTQFAPWLLDNMPRRDAQALSVGSTAAESLRKVLGVALPDVHAALSRAYRREGVTWDQLKEPSTIVQMIERESHLDSADVLVRARALEAWLLRVWDGGPHVAEALKALLVDVRCLAPELALNMSGEEISALFGQGRAAESWRVRRRGNDFLAHAGFRNTTMRFQKSEPARRTYALRAAGNHNRARGAAAGKAA